MYKIFLLLAAVIVTSFSFSQREDVIALKKEVKEAKAALKEELNDLKYDGSKTTYYEVKRSPDFKELEVILFLRDEYTLFFNGDPSPGRVSLRIFDRPSHDPNRTVLFEVRNISGKQKSVTEAELNERLSFYVQDPAPLRSVYVEYEVSRGRNAERGAVVMVLGYK